GEQGVQITANIVGFVENMKIGVLGALGLGLLLYTVISLIHKIESAFNFTWRLNGTRSFVRRFSNYLSVIMVGPVLIFSAVGITASLKSQPIIDSIQTLPFASDMIQQGGRLLPYILIIAAFGFVYVLVPNTRVKVKSALYGAIIAGILWRWTGVLFASFAASSTSFTAIYSSFAILLLFMIWLYLGWLILLVGASICYYHQHPESLRWEPEQTELSAEMQESLAFQLMIQIGVAFNQTDGQSPTQKNLADGLRIPYNMTKHMLNNLEDCGLIVRVRDKESRYLPAQSIDQIKLIDILRVARKTDGNGLQGQLYKSSEVSRLQQDIEQCQQQVLADRTLQDLVLSTLE
ncbi:MAG: YihY/virulence factor BrkB family protein, partial [Gammaproteobacteria bacterium]|nr:YihY/virulence factor BrkB family protein [Gammaproteobacteria bacterium]